MPKIKTRKKFVFSWKLWRNITLIQRFDKKWFTNRKSIVFWEPFCCCGVKWNVIFDLKVSFRRLKTFWFIWRKIQSQIMKKVKWRMKFSRIQESLHAAHFWSMSQNQFRHYVTWLTLCSMLDFEWMTHFDAFFSQRENDSFFFASNFYVKSIFEC